MGTVAIPGDPSLNTYHSTRGESPPATSFAEALFQGQPEDGGLYVPERIPPLDLKAACAGGFPERATCVLSPWLAGELDASVVRVLCERAFDFPVPLVDLGERTFLLELFHGPTAAFKDFGARFMAQTMALVRDPEQPLTVLVATSGDTGSAVASAFSRLGAARVVLLYPAGLVSPLQELQLTAVPENVISVRVDGTFDDCQAMVKAAFAAGDLRRSLGLTSANSINVARLLPQTTYYVHAACEVAAVEPPAGPGLRRRDRKAPADAAPVVVVPSGNLGNLTAGLLAKRQGAPIRHFVAACNRNDVFPRYLASGKLRPQPAVATPSNAMDVGNPSNLARIQALYGGDVGALRRDVTAFAVDDAATLEAMRRTFQLSGHWICPHTAVGMAALRRYREKTGDAGPAIVLATAHPAKFPETVGEATGSVPALPAALAALESARRPPRGMRADHTALRAFLHRLA